jgi:ubiquinone/menaquinone biosynthesis C-methylase UbiE
VGNLSNSKGLDLLVDALGFLAKEKFFRFVFTLEFEDREFESCLKRTMLKIRANRLSERTTQLSIIDYMPALMASVDLLVLPFRDTDGPSDYPVALLEGMASGVAVVGTRVGGIPELIDDDVTGILVEPGNIDMLTLAIQKILDNPAYRVELGKNARNKFAGMFQGKKIVAMVKEVYNTLSTNVNGKRQKSSENSLKFYEEEAKKYDSKRWRTLAGQLTNDVQLKIFEDSIATNLSNCNSLEIASGTGRFTKVLLDRGGIVTAMDISRSMLDELELKLKEHPNFKSLRRIVGDARSMELSTATFDLVVCYNALSHISEHKKLIAEIYRVLKPEGEFLLNIPNYLSVYLPFGLYVNLRKRSIARNVYTRWYTFKEVKRDLAEAGFDILEAKGQLHFPPATPSFLLPLLNAADEYLRNSFLLRFAPTLFIKAKKVMQ